MATTTLLLQHRHAARVATAAALRQACVGPACPATVGATVGATAGAAASDGPGERVLAGVRALSGGKHLNTFLGRLQSNGKYVVLKCLPYHGAAFPPYDVELPVRHVVPPAQLEYIVYYLLNYWDHESRFVHSPLCYAIWLLSVSQLEERITFAPARAPTETGSSLIQAWLRPFAAIRRRRITCPSPARTNPVAALMAARRSAPSSSVRLAINSVSSFKRMTASRNILFGASTD